MFVQRTAFALARRAPIRAVARRQFTSALVLRGMRSQSCACLTLDALQDDIS
jgi:hypothetical protein